ncbi:MAG: HDOD domain-containing protein [Gemmatimonadota bacterium]|nr:HDOD domain-containing protein [Gemmatimonadota bacterium]
MYDACLVRDPIFDRSSALIGYEIRFRDTEEGRAALTQSMLSGTFDIVRGGLPAFIACSRSQLLEQAFAGTDPKSLVLLLADNIGEEPEVLAALQKLRAAGGRFALDNLDETPSTGEKLGRWMEFARVDLRLDDQKVVAAICARMAVPKPRFIADQVLDAAQYAMAVKLGFDAFQGPHFSRTETIPTAQMPASTAAALRLLSLARDPNISDRALEEAVSTDPVLTFQLLRLVNSAAVGVKGVSSIGHALRIIGRTAFLRWLALAIAASRGAKTGVDQHLVRQAVERGRLLEQLSGQGRDAGTLFLVGLFSLMDSVFRMPLHDIVARVALGDDAKAALLDRTGPYAKALSFAESYELGMFESALEAAREMGVNADKLPELYATAISWTAEALGAMTKQPERKLATR